MYTEITDNTDCVKDHWSMLMISHYDSNIITGKMVEIQNEKFKSDVWATQSSIAKLLLRHKDIKSQQKGSQC
jgi:uncharacterized protein YabE (DUF348 family)